MTNNVIYQLHQPRRLAGGHVLEFAPGDGEITLLIWQDHRRDDGLMLSARNWREALRMARDVERAAADTYGGPAT